MSFWNHFDDVVNGVGSAVSEFGVKPIVNAADKLIDGKIGEATETLVEGAAWHEFTEFVKETATNIISDESNN